VNRAFSAALLVVCFSSHAADSATRVFYLPNLPDLSRTYFLRLVLRDPDGERVSSNFYWLSTQPDVTDFNSFDYRYAPITTYADLTALESLPPATVTVSWRSEESGSDQVDHVTVHNPSNALAFFVRLTVWKGEGGTDVAPVYWDDNFFELMPGETREVAATYPRKLLGGEQSRIVVDGWNLTPVR
jgi:exo-1,4-beta-D-glucosaminidase